MRKAAILSAVALTALLACGDDDGDDSPGLDGGAGTGASGSGASGTGGKSGSGAAGTGASGRGGAGTGASGRGGSDSDAGVDEDGGMEPEYTGPILERPARDEYTCSVSQELLELAPRMWGSSGHNLASAGDEDAWVARIEWMGSDPFVTPEDAELLVSRIDASGALSGDVTIPADPTTASTPVLVPRGDGSHALIWVEGAESRVVRFTVLDADGDIAVAPKTIIDSDLGDFPQPRAARAQSGEIGIVWNGTDMNAFFASVDGNGNNAGDPVQLAPNTAIAQPAIAAAGGGGFALLWKSKESPDFEAPANVFFARVDTDGAFERNPVQLTDLEGATAATFSSGDLEILPTAYGYLLAWTEGSYGETDFGTGANSGGYSVVKLQRVDADGAALAPAADVRPREDDIDEVEPTLIAFGDAVGLMWGRGTHIYICAGCVPNHSLELVLLDPVALVPISNVLKISPEAGGLLRRSAAVVGSNILTAIDITFHVHAEPGFAAFTCAAE